MNMHDYGSLPVFKLSSFCYTWHGACNAAKSMLNSAWGVAAFLGRILIVNIAIPEVALSAAAIRKDPYPVPVSLGYDNASAV